MRTNSYKRSKFSRFLSLILGIFMLIDLVFTDGIIAIAQTEYTDQENSGSAAVSEDSLMDSWTNGDYSTYMQDTMIADFYFGTKEGLSESVIQVTGEDIYNSEKGYGFRDVEYNEEAKGWVDGVYYPREAAICDSSQYVADHADYLQISSKVWTETESSGYGVYTYENTSTFDISLANADYQIDVYLENPGSEAYTAYIEAESIGKAADIQVDAESEKKVSFEANLVDGELNLKFLRGGSAVTSETAKEQALYISRVVITRLATQEAGTKPTIYLASDSTVQTYENTEYPKTGWGQTLYQFFGEFIEERECEDCDYTQSQTYETKNVIIENRAIGGRSSKSFIEEGKLDDILEDIKIGDYLFIQWGHNDATASRPNRYVSAEDFEKWILYYVNAALQRGAVPVLVTPVARYSYTTNSDGTLNSFASNFEGYRQVMQEIAKEYDVALVDLTQRSIDVCNSLGIDGSKSLFMILSSGEYENYSSGSTDYTHLQYYGGYKFAQCVAQGIKESDHESLASLAKMVEIRIPEQAPGKIENLTVLSKGSSSITLTWDSDEDAELYYIYRYTLEEGESIEDVDLTNAEKFSASSNNKYTDSRCQANMTYIYAVRGFNEKGLGELSDLTEAATKDALYKFDFNYQNSPTMEGWIGINQDQLYVEELGYGWIKAPNNGRYRSNNGNEHSSDMADDFCLGEGEFAVDLPNGDYEVTFYAGDLLAGTSTIKPSYTAEGLAIGGISARQELGSCTGTVRVEDGQLNIGIGGNPYINGITVTELQLAPGGLYYYEMEVKGILASFLLGFNGLDEAVSYNVYCKNSTDDKFSLVKNITAEQLQGENEVAYRTFTGDLGETYYYYLTAVLADGSETACSNTIEVMLKEEGEPAAAPTNLICIDPTEDTTELQKQITIQWDAVEGAVKYIVYRADKGEGDKGYNEEEAFVKVGESSTTQFTDTNKVATNISYYYKVAALTRTGLGNLSEICKTPITGTFAKSQLETYMDRGVVAVNLAGDDGAVTNVSATDAQGNEYTSGVYVSWRSFEADYDGDNNLLTTFDVYRNNTQIASGLKVTNLVDEGGSASDTYKVIGSLDNAQSLTALDVTVWQDKYLELSLFAPANDVMPDGGETYYTANDMSVGDLDGDGQLELIVKWSPSNGKDNSQYGFTGKTYLDGYDINFSTGDVTLLWRIDLGVNIRSGAHYTQFQVWDYDGDGMAEIAVKTADGTSTYQSLDGTDSGLERTGFVGACPSEVLPVTIISEKYDYRNSNGFILEGAEYFTIFNGEDGTILDTADYVPQRGNVSAWGDAYGNRVDRFLSATAYLDGDTPFAVFTRGYYTRTCLTAYYLKDTDGDGIGDTIDIYWAFDTNDAGSEYEHQGNHGLSVNDVDNDGRDEIVFGSMVIDDDGSVLYSTDLGHGDAMHVSDWVSWNDGLEVMQVHESGSSIPYHVEIHDAETGELLMGYYVGKDTGRGAAGDIDPTSEGAEFWSIGIPNYEGEDSPAWNSTSSQVYSTWSDLENLLTLSESKIPAANFTIFWDGDLLMEIQDHTLDTGVNILKWNYETETQENLLYSEDIYSNNSTKGTLGLVADLLGDWREEIIARSSADNSKIRIYSTTIETDYVVPCLLENLAYREGVAWQNVAYNQPANLSYLLSEGLVTAQLREGEANANSAEILFTEASDGTYGHDIVGYEIYRAEEDGEYERIDSVDLESLPTRSLSSEEDTDVIYSNDFENGLSDFAVLASGQDAVEQDDASVNQNTSQYIYTVFASNNHNVGSNSPQISASEDGVVLEADFRLEPGYTDSSTWFTLLGAQETSETLQSTTPQILTIGGTSSGNGYFGDFTVNGVDMKAAALASAGTEGSGRSLQRNTTGWLHLQAEIDFTNQQVKVVLTRISDGTEVYNGTVDFVNEERVESLEYLYVSAGKRYGVTSLDNVLVKAPVKENEDDSSESETLYYVYKDENVIANTTYSYKVAAIVSVETAIGQEAVNRTAHQSRELSVKTYIEIVSVPEIILDDLVEGYPIPDGKTVADLLPEAVDVIDVNDQHHAAAVTWDASNIDINKAGSYTAIAFIAGYGEKVLVPVNVIPNRIIGYEEPDKVIVIEGCEAELPDQINVSYLNTREGEEKVVWDLDELDTNVLGVHTVYGAVEGMEEKAAITIEVIADYIISVPDIHIESDINVELELPDTAKVIWASGEESYEPISWDGLSEVDTSEADIYNITGYIEGFDNEVSGYVHVVYPAVYRFDFGIDDTVAEGWTDIRVNPKGGTKTGLTLGISYDEEKGYGFADPDAVIEGRHDASFEQSGIIPQEAYVDYAIPGGYFYVDAENGSYVVDVVAACGLSGKTGVYGTVEGVEISITHTAPSYAAKSYEIEVTDGQVTFEFTGLTRLGAIVIRKAEEPDDSDPVNKEALQALAGEADSYEEADYTEESWAVMKEVLERAKELLDNDESDQASIDAMLQELKDAISGLEEIIETIAVTGVKINSSSIVTLKKGEVMSFTADISPSNAANQDIIWSISNAGVAKVDENGTVTAVSSGMVVLTVTTVDGNFTHTIVVKVTN